VRHRQFLSACLSIVGLASLGYFAGAMVIFFQLPSSALLGRAFVGARDWYEFRRSSPQPLDAAGAPVTRTSIDRPGETCDGFTLYAHGPNNEDLATQALLINMRREVVHRWAIPFSRIFSDQSHLRNRQPDLLVCFFDCCLFPNGDLLAILHGRTAPAGCGLVKLDKDSNVLWTYPGRVHHCVDVAEDGTLYALQEEIVSDVPKGFETITNSHLADYLVVLSAEGKPLREPISIAAAFQDSPYAAYLATLDAPTVRHERPTGSTAPHVDYDILRSDPLHPNSVAVLGHDLAAKFPDFKAGHVLISVRNLSVIAMLDPVEETIQWAARGPWYAQHDAQLLDNGHLLIFDNLGSPQGSRVLEYDPRTGAFPWSYGGNGNAGFFSSERAMSQRLANGNTLIVSSEEGELIEVTYDKKVVWTCSLGGYVTTARRYSVEQVSFLDGGQRARP
jgi:hypothetical protein